MYFNKLGTTEYNGIVIPDILKRIAITNSNITKSDLFEQYSIIEGETPESLSFTYYGNVDYYWTILLINNIKSRFFDWPMGSQELSQHIESKYGNKSTLFFSTISGDVNFCDTKYIQKNSTKYKVISCDRNLHKLEIQKVTTTQIQDNDSVSFLDKNEQHLTVNTINRIVYENEFALHHIQPQTKNDTTITSTTDLLLSYINSGSSPSDLVVSNLDYETQENEKKRQIVLVKPLYINQFVSIFKSLAQV